MYFPTSNILTQKLNNLTKQSPLVMSSFHSYLYSCKKTAIHYYYQLADIFFVFANNCLVYLISHCTNLAQLAKIKDKTNNKNKKKNDNNNRYALSRVKTDNFENRNCLKSRYYIKLII